MWAPPATGPCSSSSTTSSAACRYLEDHLEGRPRVVGDLLEAGLAVRQRPRLRPGAEVDLARLDDPERGHEVARRVGEGREDALLVADHLDPGKGRIVLPEAHEDEPP